VLLVYGVWYAVEMYQLVKRRSTVADEIDQSIRYTQRWIEGKTSRDMQTVFWIDSTLSFLAAFMWFSYPGQLLRMVVRREYFIDSIHESSGRAIACHMLFPAIVSLVAIQFALQHQKSYIIQRIVTLGLYLVMQAYRYFFLDISAMGAIFNGVVLVMGSAYLGLLVKIYLRLQQEGVGDVASDVNGPNQTTTFSVKKTTKAA